ncbi:hypothetical protein D3C78_1001670 [compost metagenome]
MFADGFAWVRAAGKLGISAASQANDHVLDEFFRVQRLSGSKGWARCFTLAALHTGVKTEQLVPGEVLGFLHAQQCLRVFQINGFEASRTPTAETLGTAVPGQVQSTGKGVLHRPAPGHAEEQFGYPPEHAKAQQGDQQPTTKTFRQNSGHWQGRDEEACGEHQQAFRQAHPRPF